MLFLFYSLVFSYRIRQPIGEAANLPILTTLDELKKWQEIHAISILFFMPKNSNPEISLPDFISEQLRFATYAISKYRDHIGFAVICSPELSAQMNVAPFDTPEFKLYRHLKEVEDKPLSNSPILFKSWCEEILGIESRQLIHPEQLRVLFMGHKNAIIGINQAPKPPNFPKNEIFYEAPSALFKFFELNVSTGVYIYRPADRQLVGPIQGNVKSYSHSNIIDVSNLFSLPKKQFISGYFVNGYDDNTTIKEILILNNLAAKFKDNIYFSPLEHGEVALDIFKFGKFTHFKTPFFFILDIPQAFSSVILDNDSQISRWAITNTRTMHDFDYLCSFVDDVIHEKGQKYPFVSDDCDKNDIHKLVANDFKSKIIENNNKKDKVVLFLRYDMRDANRMAITLMKVEELLKEYIDAFIFDFSKNDIPNIVGPFANQLPLFAHFPNDNKEKPFVMYPPFKFDAVVENISLHSSMKFNIPKYDLLNVTQNILDELGKVTSKKTKQYDEL